MSISERSLVQVINAVDSPQALPLAFAALGVMVQGRVAPTEASAEALRSMCRRVALARDPVPGSLLGTMQHRTLDTTGAHSSVCVCAGACVLAPAWCKALGISSH